MRRVAYLAVLAAMAVSLSGCDSFRDAAGLNKIQPDEFAVTTKAPLVIPPDYNLKPPRPGAAPTNQVGPTDAAEDAVFGTAKVATSSRGPLSTGEQELLAKAGASDSNNMIRQKIAADNRAMQAADQSFTNQILFGMGSSDTSGRPVNANAEKARLDHGGSGATTTGPAAPSSDTIKKDDNDGGWFDDIF